MVGVKKMLGKIKNNKLALGLLISLLCLTIIGVSYAVWRISLIQTSSNTISTACFDITFKEDSEAIQLEKAYPILDEEGMTGTPYTFTLTNNCDGYASYQINLEVLNETTLDSKYIKVYLDSSSPSILSDLQVTSTTLDEATTAYILNTGYFEPSESKIFNLRMWMDEDTPALEETMNKTFKSKGTITTSYLKNKQNGYDTCVQIYGEDSVQCSILANLDEIGKCPVVEEDGTVVVNSVEATDGYVCTAPDDYGTSYYFRGTVENNWVKFANSYWRIIRINGDDSIRMIYAGDANVIDALENKEEVLKNGYNDSSTDYTQIGTSTFNSSVMDNAYAGYMYGNRDGIVEGDYTNSTSHSATSTRYYAQEYTYNAETDRFTLKDPVAILGTEVTEDYVGWYTMGSSSSTTSRSYVYKITSVTPSDGSSSASIKYHYVTYGTTSKEKAQENINDSTIKKVVDEWYETHIKDTEYETYITDTLFCNDRSFYSSNTGTGAGTSVTRYRPFSGNKTLKCSQKNDRFTVDDEEIGNGDLTYPISLITIDEVYLAGGYDSNSSYYLYTGNSYWTLSPFGFVDNGAFVRRVSDDGSSSVVSVYSSSRARPVINLKAGSLKMGSGTALDPYRVE